MKRLDVLLLEQGLAKSRTAAQAFIQAGRVSYQGVVLTKASHKLATDALLQVQPDEADRFVSRGGLKILGALTKLSLDIQGMTVLDVGQSTGGFSDCVLQQGAKRVVGVDVGHDQLDAKLRQDTRVRYFEGVNARALDHALLLDANEGQAFDLMVCDVSFISLSLIFPSALPLIRPGGYLLSLVKPQFEVGREGLSHGGIVRDSRYYPRVQDKINQLLAAERWQVRQWLDSPIKGGDGNHEFFVWAERT